MKLLINLESKLCVLIVFICAISLTACGGGGGSSSGGGSSPSTYTLGTLPNGSTVSASESSFVVSGNNSTTGTLSLSGGTPGQSYTFSLSANPSIPLVTTNPEPCTLITGKSNTCQLVFNAESAPNGDYAVTISYAQVTGFNQLNKSKAKLKLANETLPNKIILTVSGAKPVPIAGSLSITSLTESIIKVGELSATTISLTGSSGITTPVNVAITSNNQNIIGVNPQSCSLTTESNTCQVYLTGESAGISNITASASGYSSVNSESLTVLPNIVPGHLVITLDESSIDVDESTIATISLVGSSGVVNPVNIGIINNDPDVIALNTESCSLTSNINYCSIILTGIGAGSGNFTITAPPPYIPYPYGPLTSEFILINAIGSVIHSFAGSTNDGANPQASLIGDEAGNLYGTTVYGGSNDKGTVFKISRDGQESIIYSFLGESDGANPYASLISDGSGNLYGTTESGGSNGKGTVFKISPAGQESIIYNFAGGDNDGANPFAGLIRDVSGNLYGTTTYGGNDDNGTAFKISPNGQEDVILKFNASNYGANPNASLIRDESGNLYGTTQFGSNIDVNDHGTVFKISADGQVSVIHGFGSNSADGANPTASLIRDESGNLYGTTQYGGMYSVGTVFKISADGGESVIHSFVSDSPDGTVPTASLIRDESGNLYGTTQYGGSNDKGTVFKISADGRENIIYNFSGNSNGANPYASLISDGSGNLYGTTQYGGSNGKGTVFKMYIGR